MAGIRPSSRSATKAHTLPEQMERSNLIPTAAQLGESSFGATPSLKYADFSSGSTGVTKSGTCNATDTTADAGACQLWDPTAGELCRHSVPSLLCGQPGSCFGNQLQLNGLYQRDIRSRTGLTQFLEFVLRWTTSRSRRRPLSPPTTIPSESMSTSATRTSSLPVMPDGRESKPRPARCRRSSASRRFPHSNMA